MFLLHSVDTLAATVCTQIYFANHAYNMGLVRITTDLGMHWTHLRRAHYTVQPHVSVSKAGIVTQGVKVCSLRVPNL